MICKSIQAKRPPTPMSYKVKGRQARPDKCQAWVKLCQLARLDTAVLAIWGSLIQTNSKFGTWAKLGKMVND